MVKREKWAVLFLAVGLIAFVSACKKKSQEQKTKEQPRAYTRLSTPDEPFVFVEVERAPVPPPPRFSAELPADVAAVDGNWSTYPPAAMVTDRLCAGDEKMRAKLIRAVTHAAKSAPVDKVVGAYSQLLGYCSAPSFCNWAHEVVNSKEPEAVRALLWHGLAGCDRLEYAPDFDRPEAPASAVISWTMTVSSREAPPFFARLVTAARETLERGNPYEARLAAVAIGSTEDPAALLALFELHREASSQEQKDALAAGFYRFRDPRARELFLDACSRSKDALCPQPDKATAPKPLPKIGADPVAALLDYRVDVGRVVQVLGDRKPALAKALSACVQKATADDEYSDWIAYRCLAELEVVDRQEAVARARGISVADTSFDPLRRGVAGLLAFPTREAMIEKLRGLGLLTGELPASVAEEPLLTVSDLLRMAGRFHQFDTETGQFPNQHDSLLRELAALVRPALDDAIFEEVAPPFEEDDPQAGHYVLRAYVGGNRYSARAQNLGDWYDVEAVVGLLNMVLVDRKSDLRLAVLPTGDQTSAVLAGPRRGLLEASSAGLIEIGEAGAGEAAGKEFEEKVLESL